MPPRADPDRITWGLPVVHLVKHGADMGNKKIIPSLKNLLMNGATTGRLADATRFIERYQLDINKADYRDAPPLREAADRGVLSVVEYLVHSAAAIDQAEPSSQGCRQRSHRGRRVPGAARGGRHFAVQGGFVCVPRCGWEGSVVGRAVPVAARIRGQPD